MKGRLFWLLLAAMSGCATVPKFESYPKTSADFELPPGEIEVSFPNVKNFHPDHFDRKEQPATLEQISNAWGPPALSEKLWGEQVSRIGMFSSVFYVALDGISPLLLVPIAVLAPLSRPPEVFTWEKGDYLVDATFYSAAFEKDRHLSHWSWKSKSSAKSAGDPLDWLARNEHGHFVFDWAYSTGGDKIFSVKDSTAKLSIGHATRFAVGYERKLGSSAYSVAGLAGISYTGFLVPTSGVRLVQYPLELVGRKRLSVPIEVGVGVSYHLNPAIDDYFASGRGIKFDNVPGALVEFAYVPKFPYRWVFRYEFVSYTGPGINEVNGNNFSISSRTYF